MHRTATALVAMTIMTHAAVADTSPGSVTLSQASIPLTTKTPADVPLSMTIANASDASDSLIRVRCPIDLVDFTEKHTTDRGEGGTAMREVKSFTIPAKGTLTLTPTTDHLMLHIREPLRDGQTFPCAIVFQQAGTVTIEVAVASAKPKPAP